MRRFRRQKESAEFTWQEPPRLKWRLQFFGSLCLFGFLLGMIIGQQVNGRPDWRVRLTTLEPLPDGLQLCFSGTVGVAEVRGQGLYGLHIQGARGKDQTGALTLADGQQVNWKLLAEEDRLQLSFVALQPVQGRWQVADERCVQVVLSVAMP